MEQGTRVVRVTCFLVLALTLYAFLVGTNTHEKRVVRFQDYITSRLGPYSHQKLLGGDRHNVPSYKPIEEDDYIHVDDLWLRDSKGKPHFIQGMNYWSCMNMGSSEAAGGNISRLLMELDQMAAIGINHLRIMAATEGSENRQPFRILPALQYKPGFWNEQVFLGLDRCIAEASKRGIRLTMVTGNTWQWTGGTANLYSWTSGKQIPYPRSWNLSSLPQRIDGFAGWGNWTRGDDDDFVRFQSQFYTDTNARKIYKSHLDQVLNRKNTITGRIYKKDATIMTWEPINEPTSVTQQKRDRDALNSWHNETAHYIKSLTPHQLVTTGYESKQSEEAFREIHTSSAIDYACAHMWPQIWGHYDMMNSSKENVQETIRWTKEYIMGVQGYSRRLGKPILLEEFGMPRDNWLNDESAGSYLYDTSAPTTHRDAVFKSIIDVVTNQYQKKQGLIGLAPWSYGGLYRSGTQQYNNHGILIAGDPPQEPPGWFSILDQDDTMPLISQMYQNISTFLSNEI